MAMLVAELMLDELAAKHDASLLAAARTEAGRDRSAERAHYVAAGLGWLVGHNGAAELSSPADEAANRMAQAASWTAEAIREIYSAVREKEQSALSQAAETMHVVPDQPSSLHAGADFVAGPDAREGAYQAA